MDPAVIFCIGFFMGLIGMMVVTRNVIATMETVIARCEEDEEEAYRAGVQDGFGYSKEPWNEEYQQVGEYLKANHAGTWPELADEDDP